MKHSPPSRQRSPTPQRWLAVLLLVLPVIAYAPAIQGEFLWDDGRNVAGNDTLLGLDGLVRIWTDPSANQQYYPLTHTSFWIERQVWGGATFGYHFTNMLLHGLTAWLFFRLLRELGIPGAFLAAALFAVHPVHAESVAWITERKNVLSGALVMGAAWAYVATWRAGLGERERRRWYAATLALFAAALLAKTVTAVLPGALIVIHWWREGALRCAEVARTLPMVAMGAAAGLFTAWLEKGHVGASGELWDFSFAERVLIAGRALWFYLGKLVAPFNLPFIYQRWTIDAGAAWQWAYPLGFAALAIALFAFRGRIGRGPLAAQLVFAGALFPALGFLNVYFHRYAFVQDHFQYLASMGPLALGAAIVTTFAGRVGAAQGEVRASRPWMAVVPGVLVLALLPLSWRQAGTFASNEALWRDTIARTPSAEMAYINLAAYYERMDRAQDALAVYEQALATGHAWPDVAFNHGVLLARLGRDGDARRAYESVLAIAPDHADAIANLGLLLGRQGDIVGADALFRRAQAAHPRDARLVVEHASVLAKAGRFAEAIAILERAEAQGISDAPLLTALGLARLDAGLLSEARAALERAIAAGARDANTAYHLGLAAASMNDASAAERAYRQAIAWDAAFAPAHNNLAILLFERGAYREAARHVELCERAGGSLHPGFVRALRERLASTVP